MSEQTTGTIADTGSSDPSMEDILASIRRIIADDAADDAAEASAEEVSGNEDDTADITSLTQDQDADLLNVEMEDLDADLDFDDILIMDDEEFSAEDLEIPNAEAFSSTVEDTTSGSVGDDDVFDAEIMEILESAEVGGAQNLTVESVTEVSEVVTAEIADVNNEDVTIATLPETTTAVSDADDDLMSLLDGDMDLVLEMDDAVGFGDVSTQAEAPVDVAADVSSGAADVELSEDADIELVDSLLEEPAALSADAAALEDLMAEGNVETESTVAHTDADEDLDLVKSLMADLTDDDLSDEAVSEESDLVDDILELSMADATSEPFTDGAHPVVPELGENEALQDQEDSDDDDIESVDASINALLEIAASAEEDASVLSTTDIAATTASIEAGQSESADTTSDTDDLDVFADLDIDLTDAGLDIDEALLEVENSLEQAETGLGQADMNETEIGDDTVEPEMAEMAGLDDVTDLDEVLLGSEYEDPATNDEAEAPDETALATSLQDTDIETEATESSQTLEILSENIPKQEKPDMPQLVARDTILDEVTEDATTAAFASLNQVVEDKAVLAERGPRVGDIVQDALRPMLKEWLDENLKGIVERAVAKEVKRISSGK